MPECKEWMAPDGFNIDIDKLVNPLQTSTPYHDSIVVYQFNDKLSEVIDAFAKAQGDIEIYFSRVRFKKGRKDKVLCFLDSLVFVLD